MRILLPGVVCAIIVAAASAHGQVIFDADFNSQPLGPLAIGSPPALPPTIITDPGATLNVVASAGNLTDKPVLAHSVPGSLSTAAFDNPSQLSSGIWRVSWDSLVLTTPVDGELSQHHVLITALSGGSFPTIWGLKYLPNGQFSVEDAGGFHSIGSFAAGSASHFILDLFLNSGAYQLSVNGISLLSGDLRENGQFQSTIFHSNGRAGGQQLEDLAFDNLVVEMVPEQGSLALGAAGIVLVLAARRPPSGAKSTSGIRHSPA